MIKFSSIKKESNQVYNSINRTFEVDKNDICQLINIAKENLSGKVRLCSHINKDEAVHEMFIVHPKGTYVRPHKHINKVRNTNETQEAWIVLRGKIEGEFFDLDDKSIFKCELCFGDCIVVYRGGQRLKVLEDNTIFYEFKNGPYFGAHEDKIDIVI